MAYLTKPQLFKAVVEEEKTADEDFAPRTRKTHDGRMPYAVSDLRLYFTDPEITRYSDDEPIIWHIVQGDADRPMTMKSSLCLKNVRVSSIHPQGAPVRYRYESGTESQAKYHLNIVVCNESGAIIDNQHIDLAQFKVYFSDMPSFAAAIVKVWNIIYWPEKGLL